MNKKQYILTCTNEDAIVVSVSAHKTKEEARAQMEKEFWAEKEDLELGGYDRYTADRLNDTEALLTGGGLFYRWKITETKMP